MTKLFQQWIYHKTSDPKVINVKHLPQQEKLGWSPDPVKFVNLVDFGVDASSKEQVQQLGDAIMGITDRINCELNFNVMKKKDLMTYAKRHFNKKLIASRSLGSLRNSVRELSGVAA